MRRFSFAAVIGSVRQVLAVTLAVLAVAGSAYLGSHKLSNPDHYAYGSCFHGPLTITHPLIQRVGSCNPPARAVWQIPLAVVLLTLGLGTAVVIAAERPRRHAPAGRPGWG
jgi:hypothetical protein